MGFLHVSGDVSTGDDTSTGQSLASLVKKGTYPEHAFRYLSENEAAASGLWIRCNTAFIDDLMYIHNSTTISQTSLCPLIIQKTRTSGKPTVGIIVLE